MYIDGRCKHPTNYFYAHEGRSVPHDRTLLRRDDTDDLGSLIAVRGSDLGAALRREIFNQ